MQTEALLLAIAGGFFMGTYPVAIKSPSVLEREVHPIIFQCYKSFWVCLTGSLFLIPALSNFGRFEFSWWGFASAAAWVPSGMCTIVSVPLLGVSMGCPSPRAAPLSPTRARPAAVVTFRTDTCHTGS
jgi:hypothetical protein